MTNKEIWEAAGVSKAQFYKIQKNDPEFPRKGSDQKKIDYLASITNKSMGRNPEMSQQQKEALAIRLRKTQAEVARIEQQIEDNQLKIIATRDEVFAELLDQVLTNLLEDLKECQLTRPQLSFLRERLKEHIKTLKTSLKDLRAG